MKKVPRLHFSADQLSLPKLCIKTSQETSYNILCDTLFTRMCFSLNCLLKLQDSDTTNPTFFSEGIFGFRVSYYAFKRLGDQLELHMQT